MTAVRGRLAVPADPTDVAAWERAIADAYPATAHWTRVAHATVSARRAAAVAATRGYDDERARVLVLAALLQDVGRVVGPDTRSHHAFTGAALLADAGLAHAASLVAQHTCVVEEARLLGQAQLAAEAVRALPAPDPELLALLTWLNATTGGAGLLMTPRQRLADIVTRRGPDAPAAQGFRLAAEEVARGAELAATNPDGTRRPKLLVLDSDGVLLVDAHPATFSFLARASRRPREALVEAYRTTLRADVLTGRVVDDVGVRLARLAGLPAGDGAAVEAVLQQHMRPFTAAEHLERWAAGGEVWVLANGRSAWVRVALFRHGLDRHLTQVLVSDELGVAKPDPRAFAALLDLWPGRPDEVLLADDEAPHVTAAQSAGMFAVHARGAAEPWVEEVDGWR